MLLKAGTTADFSDSMAAAIETALKREWPHVMGVGQTVDSNPQMRLLCIAVAQGVVRYLKDHAGNSFDVYLDSSAHSYPDGHVEIKTTGTLY